jgi:hypothetical protein
MSFSIIVINFIFKMAGRIPILRFLARSGLRFTSRIQKRLKKQRFNGRKEKLNRWWRSLTLVPSVFSDDVSNTNFLCKNDPFKALYWFSGYRLK